LTLQAQLTLNDEQAGKLLSAIRRFNAVADRLLGDASDVIRCRVEVVTDNAGASRKEMKESLTEATTASFAPRPTVSNRTALL
jgi:hypothetical protein